MPELDLLQGLLLFSLALGPLATRSLFVASSRWRDLAHLAGLGCVALGMSASLPIVCLGWLAFCAGNFALFLRERVGTWFTLATVAASVPFVFSNIAAVWLVAGANNLGLLGYDVYFSYYAALHGNVLGWILIGALAVLADRDRPRLSGFFVGVWVCLVSFLLIAFGINQLRALKPVGVVGLSIALPLAQLGFMRQVWRSNWLAFALACMSLAGLSFTMLLAWRNELTLPVVSAIPGLRGMVSVHGLVNTIVVAPCFLLAVSLATRRHAPGTC